MPITRVRMLVIVGIAGMGEFALGAVPGQAASPSATTYVAELQPLNSNVTGLETKGQARFVIEGDTLTITIDAEGLPPNMMHLQHFHGFKDGRDAVCPIKAADVDHDGIIDLIETKPFSGTTMVPFHDDPTNMQIPSETYPKASATGTYHYQKTVSLSVLQASFSKAFAGQKIDLERRVVYIHGVPPTTKLPASVASLGTIPAQITLPIACGKIKRISQ